MDGINYISKDDLKRILNQERLVDKRNTSRAINEFQNSKTNANIYYGTGLASKNELTVGVPFDFLMMPLMAEKIRRRLGKKNIYHIIADTHAVGNGFSEEKVRILARDQKRQIEDIIEKIGISNYYTFLASEIGTDRLHNELVKKTLGSSIGNSYASIEAADIEYFRITRNVGIKIGWALNSLGKFDETFFDKQYKDVFGNLILPIYTRSGKRLDNKKPNAVPYTIFKEDEKFRFIIKEQEDALTKVNESNCDIHTISMLKKHYSALVRLFVEITDFDIDRKLNVWDKITEIITILKK